MIVYEQAKRIVASYLERPNARPTGMVGRRSLAGSAPVIGRKAELAALYHVLRSLIAGKGGVVLLTGEPGLGKTRLVQECRKAFVAWVGAGSGRLPLWLEGRAASYASSSPYGLYQQLVAAWLGVVPEEGEDIVRSALVRAMWAVFPGDQADVRASLLCHMLALEPPKVAPSLSRLTPEQLQTATFEAWSAIVSRLTSHGPTVLVLEDLHWADPTSLRLTETLCSLTKDAPLLLVLTRRPEPDAGVSALEAALAADLDVRLHRLELSRLGEHAERDLTRWLLGDGTPEEVLDTVSRGVEGNPLFLEERLASLLETGVLAKEETEWRVDDSGSDDVPEALERLVRSRVDRLDADPHDAIVAASVLGPEFSLRALSAVTNMSRDLAGVLSELCATGLLSEVRNDPEPTYRFRHTLIQEATYGGLVGGERRRLHARAAWGLEEASAARLDEVASVLGHHFAMAGENERAAHYWGVSGDQAAGAFANDEAIGSYRRALDLVAAEPGAVADELVQLWLKLGHVFWRTGQYDEGRAAFRKAGSFVSRCSPVLAAKSYYWLGSLEFVDHRLDDAAAAFDAAEQTLEACPDHDADDWVETWLDVQNYRSTLCYFRNEPELGTAVVERMRPVVESRGSPRQKAGLFVEVAIHRERLTRHVIDEGILVDLRRSWEIAVEAALEKKMPWAWLELGFALLLYGDLAGAEARA